MLSWRIVVATFGAFGVVAAAWLGWAFSGSGLPTPEDANTEQLLRWLVTRDLSAEDDSTSLTLVNRLVEEAQNGWDLSEGAGVTLTSTQRERLNRNIELLKEVWFYDRVQQYGDLNSRQRFEFLEEQIETIDQWTLIATDYASQFGWSEPSASDLFAQIDSWTQAASPEQMESIDRVLRDGLVCWLATRDLRDQPLDTRQQLMRRIVTELETGNHLTLGSTELSDSQERRLQQNSELLIQAWVLDQVVTFTDRPADQRMEFVEEQVAKVRRWGILNLLAGPSAWEATETNRLMELAGVMRLRSLFEEWIQMASPKEKEQLQQLKVTVQEVLMRQR